MMNWPRAIHFASETELIDVVRRSDPFIDQDFPKKIIQSRLIALFSFLHEPLVNPGRSNYGRFISKKAEMRSVITETFSRGDDSHCFTPLICCSRYLVPSVGSN
jgi:hypothetical protein